MKRLWIILVLIGLAVASYPLLDRAYSWHLQKRIFAEMDQDLHLAQEGVDTTQFVELQDIFVEYSDEPYEEPIDSIMLPEEPIDSIMFPEESTDAPTSTEESDSTEEEPLETNNAQEIPQSPSASPSTEPGTPLGVIHIEKINLRLPIIYGTSKSILRSGVGQIKSTTSLGQVGNAALAAHRSHTFGRFFNRLDELEIGDEIRVQTKGGDFVYVVYKKHVVEPNDLSVLNKNNSDRVITLITCDPIITATHRLIVHGVIQD